MKILSFVLLVLLVPFVAFAGQWAQYAFEDSDGVHVLHINPKVNTTVEAELAKMGKAGTPYVIPANVPSDKVDRKYWKLNGNTIEIDLVKKQADLDALALKKAKKDAVLAKLKISEEDWKEVNDKSVNVGAIS